MANQGRLKMKIGHIITTLLLLMATSGVVLLLKATPEDIKRELFRSLSRLAQQNPGSTASTVLGQLKYAIEKQNISPSAIDSSTGLSLLMAASRTGSLSLVTYLVSQGANVTYKSTLNETALMYAALNGNLPVVQFLVMHGADVNANSYGWSVLKWSKDFDQPTGAVTKYLLKLGVEPQKHEWGYFQYQQKREQQ